MNAPIRKGEYCGLLRPLVLICLLASPLTSQTNFLTIAGIPSSNNGGSVAVAGDVTGDGIPDVLSGHAGNSIGQNRVTLYSGADGSIVHVFLAPVNNTQFGLSVDGGVDVDGDDVPDILVGAPRWSPTSPISSDESGAVYLYSGQTGRLIRVHIGQPGQTLGTVVRFLDDFDDDGVGEYAMGAPHAGLASGTGEAFVVSGETGNLVYPLVGEHADDRFGQEIALLGDIDDDNTADVAIGAAGASQVSLLEGAVHIYSGGTGSLIRTDRGDGAFTCIGKALASLDDINSDGTPDYGATWFDLDGFTNRTAVVDGSSGGVLTWIYSPLDSQLYLPGWPLSSIEDHDGDGLRDLIIKNLPDGSSDGHVLVASSVTGEALFYIMDDDPSPDLFPQLIAHRQADLDGDGMEDILVANAASLADGAVFAYSVRALYAFSSKLPADTGGEVQCGLSAGVEGSGDAYFMLAGFSGTQPGFDVGVTHVPLNYDVLTDWSVNWANSAPFINTFGVLDPVDGKASASFDLTGIPLPPAAVGLTLSFAYAVKGEVGGVQMDGGNAAGVTWYFASNPENVEIVASIPGS